MSDSTNIEYLDATWNFIRVKGGGYHCTKVSPGCAHCWAEARNMNRFFKWGNGRVFDGSHVEFEVHRPAIELPGHWRKGKRIGVQFMGDLFHPDVPFELVDWGFAWMASLSHHTFFVLTKRVDRMAEYFERVSRLGQEAGRAYEQRVRAHFEKYKMQFTEGYTLPSPPTPELRHLYDSAAIQEQRPTSPDGTTLHCGFSGREFHWRRWPLDNVVTGCSISTRPEADEMLRDLVRIPGLHWVSVEPQLGPMPNLYRYLMPRPVTNCPHVDPEDGCCLHPEAFTPECHPGADCPQRGDNPPVPGLHLIVLGGETGPKARPMHPVWVRSVRDQCVDSGTPFFFKHWGEYSPVCHYYDEDDDVRDPALDRPHVLLTRVGAIWDVDRDGQPPAGAWIMHRVGRKKAGRLLDGREWNGITQ